MTTPMRFRAITANCGNDVIGEEASHSIATLLSAEELDFVVINCQEVNTEETKRQLEQALGDSSEYSVTLLSKMATHTKPREQLHRNTGLASFVIHKKSLSVQVTERVKARRAVSRLSGSGYNKGGLVTGFTVSDSKHRTIRLQTISGHLDSKNTAKRIKDWAGIHSAMAKKEVGDWSELVAAMPNVRIAGYDANTRNQYTDELHDPVKIWDLEGVPQELTAFQQAPIGGFHYSVESTYKTFDSAIDTTPDRKRPGYVRGGMMDFVDVASDVEGPSSLVCDTARVDRLGCEANTERDHDVIISPLQTYDESTLSEFERVKHQMMTQLRTCAPSVVQEMERYTVQDEEKLIEIYNQYLSKNGLVNQQIKLQSDFLSQMSQIKKINSEVGHRIESLLQVDQAWFLTDPLEIEKKQAFQSAALHALGVCRSESDLNTIERALEDPATNTEVLNDVLRSLLGKYQAGVLSQVYARSKKHVNDLLQQINAIPFEAEHPEKKAGQIIQLAFEFTNDINQELKTLQQSNSPGKAGVRKALLAMMELVKTLVIDLIELFAKKPAAVHKTPSLKQIEKSIRHLHLNLPPCLEKLRLNLSRNLLPTDFTKIKIKSEEQKLSRDDTSGDTLPMSPK